jgi:cell division protein FtsW (lipid II flippase)
MSDGKEKARLLRFWPRLLFLIPLVAMLWVASYNRTAPELGGIPFFYWYQLAWILIGAAIVLLVYWIETHVTRVAERPPHEEEPSGTPGDIL